MGIILFLVDTSASMNQRTYLGTSYLDVAKGAIETFMKYRARDPASRGDRYMLVSFDDPPNAVKAGWKESHYTFVSELKNLQATSLSSYGQALKEAFNLLNLHRLHTSIDHYGQGRNPFFLEPAVIIALTDGGRITNPSTTEHELFLPLDTYSEGSELTKESFRWDQRLFTVLLRLPGVGGGGVPGGERQQQLTESSISTMCEATGGKCYVVFNQKSLAQCMEALTQKLHPGVVINFQKIGGSSPSSSDNLDPTPMEVDQGPTVSPENTSGVKEGNSEQQNGSSSNSQEETGAVRTVDQSTAWHNTRKMIFVKTTTGFWPIPESFWPDTSISTLSPRDVHPVVWFDTRDTPLLLVENFPFDKYELEPSPLTQYILQRRNPNICWQVYIENSGKEGGLAHPFGYLKASSSLTHVTLFVMPYNFSTLLPLIEELQKHRMRPPQKWRLEFAEYIASVPAYYAQPLRNAFRLIGAPSSLIADSFDGQMSYSVTNYLRKLKKQAKMESERVIAAISKNRTTETPNRGNGIVDLGESISIAIGSTQVEEGVTSQSFRNPFDIARSGLLRQLARMRTNFLHASPTTPNLIEEVLRHQVPIGEMGNYQEHLKKINPLRELDSGAVRTRLFGNPFKLDRASDVKQREAVDIGIFADEHMVEMNQRQSGGISGRRRRLRSPSSTPQRSPKPPSPSPTPSTKNNTPQPVHSNNQGLAASQANGRTGNGNGDKKQEDSNSKEQELPVSREGPLPVSKEVKINLESQAQIVETDREVNEKETLHPMLLSSEPNPALTGSTTVLDQRNISKSLLDKVQQVSRKRERTPSPTPGAPSAKRQALNSSGVIPPPSKVATSAGTPPPHNKLGMNFGGVVGKSGHNHSFKATSLTVPSSGPPVVSRLPKPEISSASKVLNEEIQKQQGQENARLKALIVKEVRKPGKNYDTIFQHLEGVRGSVEVRKAFVEDIVREASKFKKKQLIQQLEEWGAKLTSLKTGALDSKDQKPLNKPKMASQRR